MKMDNRSLLEVLHEEKKICDRLQSVENMLSGLQGAAEEGRTSIERHTHLMDRLTEEGAQLGAELFSVRQRIAVRLDDYKEFYGGKNNE